MTMDMSSSSSMSGSMTSMAPAAASSSMSSMSSGMSMGGMDGMGSGDCRISMLWNWYTVDACFLASSWHVTSHGMFAGSCIGVICLVLTLEFLRRVQREHDRLISAKAKSSLKAGNYTESKRVDTSSDEGSREGPRDRWTPSLRPNLLQQAMRATIHMLQFAVAYFIMLLAMYFNGYIIICIFIGAWIGSFLFSWDQLAAQTGGDATEVTGCCG